MEKKWPSIEEYITYYKERWGLFWQCGIYDHLKDEADIWGKAFSFQELLKLSNEAYEQVFLDKWSHNVKNEQDNSKGLFSGNNFILQVHGCIHKDNEIASINPNCKHNFINVNLAKRLHIPAKYIQSTKVDSENVKNFKDLKVTMDKYVLHSDFYALDMGVVNVVLGYPWMDSIGTININVQKNCLKLWYKKKKITL
jgi:hypothetical protein